MGSVQRRTSYPPPPLVRQTVHHQTRNHNSHTRPTLPRLFRGLVLVLSLAYFLSSNSLAVLAATSRLPAQLHHQEQQLLHDAEQKARLADRVTITTPPDPSRTQWMHHHWKRASRTAPATCENGYCGNGCIPDGAFCCNPGGNLAQEPQWVCGNGACYTSVIGRAGIVDCYDPAVPSGTTLSCVDFQATSSCNSGERCFTCSADMPYCNWQTYIQPGPAPTLSWYSCDTVNKRAEVFYATSVTKNLLVEPQSTALSTSNTSSLGTGAIIGVSLGGAVVVIFVVAIVACLRVRSRRRRDKEAIKDRQRISAGGRGYVYPNGDTASTVRRSTGGHDTTTRNSRSNTTNNNNHHDYPLADEARLTEWKDASSGTPQGGPPSTPGSDTDKHHDVTVPRQARLHGDSGAAASRR